MTTPNPSEETLEEGDPSLGSIIETVRRVEGLHVGLLTEDEQDAFRSAVLLGLAYRQYEGPAGFLGLAKVRLTNSVSSRELQS